MMYYRLIAYMLIANELIFKNFVLSDCRKDKLHSRILVEVLRGLSCVERKVDEPAQIGPVLFLKIASLVLEI